jgi:nicotinate-nucleotide adenylyltransferase
MRVGLLGGSFNPAHDGHRHVADTARARLGLHKVIWLVSPQNPLKRATDTAPLARRMAQTRVIAKGPSDIVSDIETDLGSAFTIDTLRALKRRWPAVRFVWLMGSDNLSGLHRWREWRALGREIEAAIVPRPGSGAAAHLAPGGRMLRESGQTRFVNAPLHTASSTALRVRAMGPL